MAKQRVEMELDVNIEFLKKKLEALRDGIAYIIAEIDRIERNVCRACGGELQSLEAFGDGNVTKMCVDCGQEYQFAGGEGDEG